MNFIKEYITYVSDLGREVSIPEWWFTSLSSKNRFQSPLMALFEEQKVGTSSVMKPEIHSVLFILRALIAESVKSFVAWTVFFFKRRRLSSSGIKFYVLKTFSYPQNYKNEFSDSYWGELPDFLSQHGDVIQIAKPLGCLKTAMKFGLKKQARVIPVYAYTSPIIFLKSVSRLISAHFTWKHPDPEVMALLRNEIFNDSFFYSILMEEVFYSLSRQLNIKKVFIPFEGNAWERGVVSGVKRAKREIPVIGYVHTVIPEISTNLFLGPEEFEKGPFPDEIHVLGKVPLELMNENSFMPQGVLVESAALRFKELLKLKPLPEKANTNVLVVLEGVIPAAQIVDYIFDMAPKCENWNFYLRFHPALPWEKMKSFCKHKAFPVNVQLSPPQSLFKDIDASDICLYWGSTAGVEALFLGKPVVHLDLGSILSYDPLFMHDGYHWKIGLKDELFVVLQKIKCLSEDEKNKLISDSQKFLRLYFNEISQEKLKQFL